MPVLYSITIALSSLLLFLVQPMMAKTLLPQYGGSAGVWIACMLFFQVMLLGGYCYSWLVTARIARKTQGALHLSLTSLSLTLTRLHPHFSFADPTLDILATLLISIGFPYFILSATSPLMQAWMGRSPYRLFALSNAASLAALLAYPVLIEPNLPLSTQHNIWWIGYALVALLLLMVVIGRKYEDETPEGTPPAESVVLHPLLWIALAACASTLWMATANHLSREVAPVPFLWILPLGIYLLTFILCFEGDNWYRPEIFRWLLAVAWLAAGAQLSGHGATSLTGEIAVFGFALFVWCMFCHGEIARTKPAIQALTRFYLLIALGGAVGAIFVALIAPNILTTYLELPIGIAVSAVLALRVLYGMTSPWRLLRLSAVAIAAFVVATYFEAGFGNVTHIRNFYGALQVSDNGTTRTLYHGRTLHGIELLQPNALRWPTAYYGGDSGVGRILSEPAYRRRVGLVGLGVGTLAAYARSGDLYRFYEINPAVIQLATTDFGFLNRNSRGVFQIVRDDGRLALERERSNSFDILVLDAFADDSVPVHLLTREAFRLYFRLLHSNGTLAIHITNRYLDLAPVIAAAAKDLGVHAAEVHSQADPTQQILAADWVLVSTRTDLPATPLSPGHTRLWTDDYSNLFQLLK